MTILRRLTHLVFPSPALPMDIADVFPGGDDDGSSELRVNAGFAARFDVENARREAQRYADATAASPLSEAAIQVLLRCAAKTITMVRAKLLRAQKRRTLDGIDSQLAALGDVTPALAAATALKRANFRFTAAAGALLDHRSVEDPAIAAALMRVVGHSQILKQLTSLARFLLRSGGPPAPRSRSDPLARPPAASGAGDGIGKEDSPATGSKRHRSDLAAAASSVVAAEASAGVLPHRQLAKAVVMEPPSCRTNRHPHGRGAGRGRGLGPSGEPAFADLHPSWEAKRRTARREAKTVSKRLRALQASGAGADSSAV